MTLWKIIYKPWDQKSHKHRILKAIKFMHTKGENRHKHEMSCLVTIYGLSLDRM